ncbi:MAG TPA: hypothetical protein VHI52_18475, partial [Verrucomicrobiae bacterium]|nr:hypothetical protein [Verrucomicrobiae bacterium]
MNAAMPRAAEVVLGILLTGLSVEGATAAESSLPDAAAVMQNVLRRAEAEGKADPAAGYSYEKHSLVEELDAEGKPTRTTDQTYTVFPIGGVPYSRLVKVQNRSLTPREMREQDRKEAEFRKKVAGPDAEKAAKANHQDLDPALVARFDFQVERRTLFGD